MLCFPALYNLYKVIGMDGSAYESSYCGMFMHIFCLAAYMHIRSAYSRVVPAKEYTNRRTEPFLSSIRTVIKSSHVY
jgi:hypothetical protein